MKIVTKRLKISWYENVFQVRIPKFTFNYSALVAKTELMLAMVILVDH